MLKIRVGAIICQNTPDGHIVGSTTRITTDYIAGWCGVDLVQEVGFDQYRGKLTMTIEGRKYSIRCRKTEALRTLINFLKNPDKQLEPYRVREYKLRKAEVWQLDMWADPEGGWYENNRFRLGVIEIPAVCDSRKLCSLLRKRNWLLSAKSLPVHVSHEYYDCGRLEVCQNNGAPVLSVEFIEEEE